MCPLCLCRDLRDEEDVDWLTGPSLETGATSWAGFVLGPVIGAGGMGSVYRARQLSPARDVAIKVLSQHGFNHAGARERFLGEAEALAELNHPGILPLYASGEHDGVPWMGMPLARGGNLAMQLSRWQRRWRDMAALVAQLAAAVQHAHERGVIHRDLKPGNILFDELERPMVADFGLAKWLDHDSGRTLSQSVLGTPAYMAPEVARQGARAATIASDVYGLGAILYELATGRPPFFGPTPVETARRVLADAIEPPRRIDPEVPRDLDAVILKALHPEPSQRYASAAALAADLDAWLEGRSLIARPPSVWEKSGRWVRKHPAVAALATALIALAIVSGVSLWQAYLREREARTDALERVIFMTQSLPAQLQPIGQLAVLDSVFADLDRYFTRLSQRTLGDPVPRVQQAEFQVQWFSILRQQGRIPEARERAVKAIAAATEATRLGPENPSAWTVLAASHRCHAELDTIQNVNPSAAEHLSLAMGAVDAGLQRHPTSFGLHLEKAETLSETAFLKLREREPVAALAVQSQAETTLAMLRPPGASESPVIVRKWRDLRLLIDSYQGECLIAAKRYDEAVQRYTTHLDACQRAFTEHPEDMGLLLKLKTAHNRLGDALARQARAANAPQPIERLLELARQEEKLAATLAGSDPRNLYWQSEWATAALALAQAEHMGGDRAASRHWLEECLRLLKPVPIAVHNEVLEMRSNALLYLTQNLAAGEDWTAGAGRCVEALQAAWEVLLSRADDRQAHQSFQNRASELFALQTAQDPKQAISLIRQWTGQVSHHQAPPEQSRWWLLTRASLHRRLANALLTNDPTQAAAENGIALDCRTQALRQAREANDEAAIPSLRRDVLSTAETLLAGAPSADTSLAAAASLLTVGKDIALAGEKERIGAARLFCRFLQSAPSLDRAPLARRALDLFFPTPPPSGSPAASVAETLRQFIP